VKWADGMPLLTDEWSSQAHAACTEAGSRKRNARRSGCAAIGSHVPRQPRASRKSQAEATDASASPVRRPSHTKLSAAEAAAEAPPARAGHGKLLSPTAASSTPPSSARRRSQRDKSEPSSADAGQEEKLTAQISAWALDASAAAEKSTGERGATRKKQTRTSSATSLRSSGSAPTQEEATAIKAKSVSAEDKLGTLDGKTKPKERPRKKRGSVTSKTSDEQSRMPKADRKKREKASITLSREDGGGLIDAWLAAPAAEDEAWETQHDHGKAWVDPEPADLHSIDAERDPKDPAAMVEDRVKGVMEATGATTGEALQALEAAGWNAEVAVNQVIDERVQVQAAEEASKAETQSSSSRGGAKKRAESTPIIERQSQRLGGEALRPEPLHSAFVFEDFLQRSPRATMASPRSSMANPRSSSAPRLGHSGGFLSRLSTAASSFVETVSGQSSEWLDALKRGASNVSADVSSRLSRELGAALARDDSRKVNLLVDSALGGALIGKSSPPIIRRAANETAAYQLQEALRADEPKRLKGALVAARRLDATDLPEFHACVRRYHELKRFPDNWDVNKMLHGRRGDKMVAKQKVSDPAIVDRFQRLLDSTHRKVYTRDRGGEEIPDRLKLVKVVEVANGELYVDYMARQEAIRREIMENWQGYWPVKTDTSLIADGSFSWQGDDWRWDWSEVGDGPPQFALTDPPLDRNVNEVLLFHGTSHTASDSITTENFSVDFAGSYAGTLYGRGVYLAENASKSDEYTRPDPATGNRTMLVCRVTLGRTYYTDQVTPDPRACEYACLNGPFHSVIGDRRKSRGTFREFVVFDEEQVYANYILTYRRVRLTAKHGTE